MTRLLGNQLLLLILVVVVALVKCDNDDNSAAQKAVDLEIRHRSSSSSSSSTDSSSSNSVIYEKPPKLQAKQLFYNSGFFSFNFGPTGTLAFENYLFLARSPAYLVITDCFCGGDTFQLLNQDTLLADVSTNCSGQTSECLNYQEDPNVCKDSAGFCSQRVLLDPGFYNLTLLLTNSIVGSGRAFVWIDDACLSPITNTNLPCCEVLNTYDCNYQYTPFQ